MNERHEQIKNSIIDSLEKAKTALKNKFVEVDSLKVSQLPEYIRQIEPNKIKLTIYCSEFDSGTITATKDGKVRTGVVEAGKAVIMLPSEGNWHIEHELGDYVETQVSGLDATCELVKKKVTFSKGECSKEKLVIHIDSVVGNNSNDNFIRVKMNGVTIEAQAQLVGSDIEITGFEYEEGATYTVEYVLSEEVRGSVEVVIIPAEIFGFKITESIEDPTDRVSYTDSAVDKEPVTINFEDGTVNMGDWENTWLFDKIYPAMVKYDGTIDYKLDRNDQTLKENGEPSDVNNIDFDGNAMVIVEKFYTKFGMDGEDEVIQFSNTPHDGFEAIGFIREDDSEADYICLPMFMGSFDSSNKLRSISGQSVKYRTSFTDFRTAAQKNGTGYDIETYAQNQIISALEILMFKSCDWRNKLGEGRTNNGNTGILTNKGAIAFDPSSKAVKFLWMEDFVSYPRSGSNFYKWEAGILCQNQKNYVRMKPPYSGTDVSTYEEVTDHVYKNGYISKMKCDNKYGRTSVETSGTETTYETCYWCDNSNTYGGVYASLCGLNYCVAGRYFLNSASNTNNRYGAALSYLPPAQS